MRKPGKDALAELLELAAREKREHAKAAKTHTADAARAREVDRFCRERLQTGRREDAVEWIQSKNHTLGERTPAASRRLVDKLRKLGAVAIHACEIDSYDDLENTGHMVVELPAAGRAPLLKELDRLAREQGYEGDLDDGQKYAYVKLD